MRIMHVITRLIRAGADENTVTTCVSQAASGHEVFLVHGREFDRHFYDKRPRGVKLVKLDRLGRSISPLADFFAFCDLYRLYLRYRPDVVHTHTSKAGVVGRLAAKAAGVKTIIHGVHIAPFANVKLIPRLAFLLLERAAARVTDAFIDVSHGMKDLCVSAGVGASERHYVVHSGFDLKRYQNASLPPDWRELLRLAPGEDKPFVVVVLAALVPRKRHCQLLEAFADVVGHFPKTRLILAGEGVSLPAIERCIQKLHLADNVCVAGFRDDPERMVALADVCVLASEQEGLPRVVVQYIAGGKPCIVSSLPGIEEVVRHGHNGIVTSPDDVGEIASALIGIISDPRRLADLSAGARATDLSSWDADLMWPRMQTAYSYAMGNMGA